MFLRQKTTKRGKMMLRKKDYGGVNARLLHGLQ